ncbi:MAG: N-acyl-D-amino-acid deacylase [Planctomycetota bacterium]|jgi:N-acyl-D-amino-acid deacylase
MARTSSRRTFLKQSLIASSAAAMAPLGACRSVAPASQLDLVLRGGTIVDGTGKAGFVADIGMRGDRIVVIGAIPGGDHRVVDASGLVVAPGFIDVHAHTDLRRQPKGPSKVYQGVTTDITGPDGGSRLPRRLSDDESTLVADAGACASYDAWAAEHGAIAMNIGSYVGHGTVRRLVLGNDGRAPTAKELQVMQSLIEQALEQGAMGLSSGLEYFPGNMTATDELVQLCAVAAKFDRPYVTHIRNEDDQLLEAIDEAIEIARRAKTSLLISHAKVGGKPNWHKVEPMLERIEQARREGLEVRCDRYPYEAWSTSLSTNFPGWSKEGGHFIKRLQDPAERSRMRAETEQAVAANGGWGTLMLGGGLAEQDKVLAGRRIDEIATERGVEPFELACELLTRGNVSILGFGMSEANMDHIMVQPYCMVASDGSAVTAGRGGSHPRSFGTFPRAWRRYVRERKLLSAEEMVRKMTSLPAQALRMTERGTLAPGMIADVVAFDADRFTDRATYLKPQQYAEGVAYLVVNGSLVVAGGKQVPAMPGRIVRG